MEIAFPAAVEMVSRPLLRFLSSMRVAKFYKNLVVWKLLRKPMGELNVLPLVAVQWWHRQFEDIPRMTHRWPKRRGRDQFVALARKRRATYFSAFYYRATLLVGA